MPSARFEPVRLSVLICGITERLDGLKALLTELNEQARSVVERVEVLALVDDRFLTVGDKRNRLVSIASGDYVAFVDDDDWVYPDYVIRLIQALRHDPDVATFTVEVTLDGGKPKPCYYSIHYPDQGEVASHYWRWPNHLCAIRRDLALAHPFHSRNFGEDTAFAESIRPDLKREVKIDRQLYKYRFSSHHTATQRPT